MITKNKLANQPNNKLTKSFNPVATDVQDTKNKPHKGRKRFLLLFLLLVVVAGTTFGVIWLFYPKNKDTDNTAEQITEPNPDEITDEQPEETESTTTDTNIPEDNLGPITNAPSANPTIEYGRLMLINPNFPVEPEFIAARKSELISLASTYGIQEAKSSNGDNLMDKEAASWLNKMLAEYTIAYPGHTMQTRSCFREVGTNCGRMCAATGTSDHHTGLTCDLIDSTYGTDLNTDAYTQHAEWQWLRSNSYKYGFIDRFPEAWAGGLMSEPLNVDENGTTGLFETWHYRYVGVFAATEIATGVYNNGAYDSLEHYLLMRGLVSNLLNN